MQYIFLINTVMLKKEAHTEEQHFETEEAMSKPRPGLEEVICGSRNGGRRHDLGGLHNGDLQSQEQLVFWKNKRQPYHFVRCPL